ncbi:NADH-quinone oxidoreductase subunit C [Geomonas sp. RF6]|uniref:NADH-quinone oxidoreductase subunit C n=1 Tax=Geomonas sp. RF6 TaxID=2897342 RepID=UPI001E5AE1D8|nr:NADH-quinone oxidoreductase subunit C [Geomonas sp. RF6]UFS68549.1 NADH-quinone oxidoreductase subunit C [Geomonas sp. RF6]
MNEFQEKVAARLRSSAGKEVEISWRASGKGVQTGWCTVAAADLFPVAQGVQELDGRLSAITGYLCAGKADEGARQLAYHFDLDGATLTVTVPLPLHGATVPSLTPIFRSADWNERELMELYEVEVAGHPDPRRLFLDESLEPAALERLIPYSSFINAASPKTLFEKVLLDQGKEGAR